MFVRRILAARKNLNVDDISAGSLNKFVPDFLRRHAKLLAVKKAQHCSVDRVLHHDSKLIDEWFERLRQIEQQMIAEGQLDPSGFKPFQVLNFDEANSDPQGKPLKVIVSRTNKSVQRASTSDRPPFHVSYGCLTSALGEIICAQVIHAIVSGEVSDVMIESFNIGRAILNRVDDAYNFRDVNCSGDLWNLMEHHILEGEN